MVWMRQHLLTILFGALVVLQAVGTLMQVVVLSRLDSIRSGVWNSSRFIGENITNDLKSIVLKVAICDTSGRNCADTSVAKVTTTPNFRTSPSDPMQFTTATYGLVVTNPDRP
jgi:hypothetical protein